jgi:TRAP-type C4-dicarboxylate transport system substrate-binding protein
MKVIALSAVTSLRLMSKTPVRSLADLKGMRIKTGRELIAPLKHYGAEGIIIPSVETYETLQKGIINAAFQQAQYYKAARLTEVVKYDINLTSVMGPFPNKAMSLKSWNKLPKEIQKIFEDSGDKWTLFMLDEIEKTDKDIFDMAKKAGITFIELPPSEIQDFNALTDQEALKTSKELDAKGLPGTKMYEEVKRLIKVYSKK